MAGKYRVEGNRKKRGANSRKRAAAWALLLCLFAGCGKREAQQEAPVVQEKDASSGKTSDAEGKPPVSSVETPDAGGKPPAPSAETSDAEGKPSAPSVETPDAGGKPPASSAEAPDAADMPPASSGSLGNVAGDSAAPAPEAGFDDFLIVQDTLAGYNGTEKTVIVPEGVRAIGAKAFRGNAALETLVLPEGVTTIGRKPSGIAGI